MPAQRSVARRASFRRKGTEDAVAGDGSRVRACCAIAEVFDGADDGGGQESCPGEEPEDEQEPEDGDGDLAVVVGDAAAEEAGDVLVVEVEPGPAGFLWEAKAGGHRDRWITERGEDVPGECDGEEEERRGDDAELAEEREFAGEGKVEDREGDREDDADEALGEEVEGEDGGEAEHGEERGAASERMGLVVEKVSAVEGKRRSSGFFDFALCAPLRMTAFLSARRMTALFDCDALLRMTERLFREDSLRARSRAMRKRWTARVIQRAMRMSGM